MRGGGGSTDKQLALFKKAEITSTALIIKTDITEDEWLDIGIRLGQMEGALMWWIGDWILAAGNVQNGVRSEIYDFVENKTGLARSTLRDAKSICGKYNDLSIRIDRLTFNHHRVVADVSDPEERKELLDWAVENNATVQQLKNKKREKVYIEMPFPEGKYLVLLADPSWKYKNTGFNESAQSQYPTMEVEEICSYTEQIQDISTDQSILFLWATNPLLIEAIQVLTAWGFEYKTVMAWIKDKGRGKGWYLKSKHELLLIGTRTKTPEPLNRPDSCFEAKRTATHSQKPIKAYELMEWMYPVNIENPKHIELYGDLMEKGKNNEEILLDWLRKRGRDIIDFRKFRLTQRLDVDCGIETIDGKIILAELKSDIHIKQDGNYFHEIFRINHYVRDKWFYLGWGYRSPAQTLIVRNPNTNETFIFDFLDLRTRIGKYVDEIGKEIKIETIETDKQKTTFGFLIPIKYLHGTYVIRQVENPAQQTQRENSNELELFNN